MEIRKATGKDIEGVWRVYEKVRLDRSRLGDREYETRVQRQGFLLGLDTREELVRQIESASEFLVAVEFGRIIGYTAAEHNKEYRDDEYKTWFDAKIKDVYYQSPKAMTISATAVDPEFRGRHVGSELSAKLEAGLRKKGVAYLFTIIAVAPLTNCPMIAWRTKSGFDRVAMGRPRDELFGLKQYASLLMCKKISG